MPWKQISSFTKNIFYINIQSLFGADTFRLRLPWLQIDSTVSSMQITRRVQGQSFCGNQTGCQYPCFCSILPRCKLTRSFNCTRNSWNIALHRATVFANVVATTLNGKRSFKTHSFLRDLCSSLQHGQLSQLGHTFCVNVYLAYYSYVACRNYAALYSSACYQRCCSDIQLLYGTP